MNNPRFARLVARALGRSRRDDAAVEAPSAGVRAQAVTALERALVERRRRLARRRVVSISASGLVAAAALLGLALLVLQPDPHALGATDSHPRTRPSATGAQQPRDVERASEHVEVIATESGGESTLLGGHAQAGSRSRTVLPAGSRVITPAAGTALLALSTGTRLTVGARSDFSVVGDGAVEVFRLDRGALSAEVAKLEAGQRFLIDTPDAEVEVHGTVFDVLVGEPAETCGGGRTRVVVSEGVVTVRRGAAVEYVRAGEHWPRECASTRVTARRAEVDGTEPRAHEPAVGVIPPVPSPASAPVAAQLIAAPSPGVGSRLAAMNDAFASAVALRQRGQIDLAIGAFARFADDYRGGPLEESARVELLRLLVRTDRARARTHAEHYLTDFPDGFARQEAARVLE